MRSETWKFALLHDKKRHLTKNMPVGAIVRATYVATLPITRK